MNRTSWDFARNRKAVSPRNLESPENQGVLWDNQEHIKRAAKQAVGRSKTQRQEQSGDSQEYQT